MRKDGTRSDTCVECMEGEGGETCHSRNGTKRQCKMCTLQGVFDMYVRTYVLCHLVCGIPIKTVHGLYMYIGWYVVQGVRMCTYKVCAHIYI